MRSKIFYKFFIIILCAFLFIEYLHREIDYQSTLNYRLSQFQYPQENELSSQFASYVKENNISLEEFYAQFESRFDHEGYCYHVLVKDTPLSSEISQNIILENGKEDEYLLQYDKDIMVKRLHGVKYIQPYIVYYHKDTGTYETVYENKYEAYSISELQYLYQFKDVQTVICEAQSPLYSYGFNGYAMQLMDRAVLVEHADYRLACEKIIQEYQVIKNYEGVQSFYKIIDNDVIFFTKTYVGTDNGEEFFYQSDEDLLRITQNDSSLANDCYREVYQWTDYYVYSFFYMDSVELMSNINNEVQERNQYVSLVVFGLAIVISLFLSWMLTRHIKEISKATSRIARHDFSQPLKEYSNDELGSLAMNINLMSVSLEETMKELQEEIEHVKNLENIRKEFIANFTHEIKTPLGIINGYIELINKSENIDQQQTYLSAIQKETTKINQQVLAMLDLSRLEAGKIDLNIQEVDLEDLVSDLLESFFPMLKQKHIKVKVDLVEAIIQADPQQIEKVVRNYLSNAIYHCLENGKIYIGFKEGKFFVENEGKQLSSKEMTTVFETYVSSNREGTGLGLAICKAILELHQFNYGVYNTKTGVAFYFEPF